MSSQQAEFFADAVESVYVGEFGSGDHVSSECGEFAAVTGFLPCDQSVAVLPVFEQIVEE